MKESNQPTVKTEIWEKIDADNDVVDKEEKTVALTGGESMDLMNAD